MPDAMILPLDEAVRLLRRARLGGSERCCE